MTATWTGQITRGWGAIDLRLEIEGWPVEWTTNARITHSGGADGRGVYPGLLYEGIEIQERAVLQEASLDVRGITFSVVSTGPGDEAMANLSRRDPPLFWLASSISATATALTLEGSQTLTTNSYYHLATETIKSTAGNTVSRGEWGTTGQRHNIALENLTTINAAEQAVPVYGFPPSMMGRRAFLYGYGESDAGTGNGTVIWRGVVSAPPRLDRDTGGKWLIDVDPITTILKQEVPPVETEARLRGIYHSNRCAIYILLGINGNAVTTTQIIGYHANQEALTVAINDEIDTLVSTVDSSNTYIDFMYYTPGIQGIPYVYLRTAGTAPSAINFAMWSPLEGYAESLFGLFRVSDDAPVVASGGEPDSNESYRMYFTYEGALSFSSFKNTTGKDSVFVGNYIGDRMALGIPHMYTDFLESGIRKYSDTTSPPWTIFLDTDLGANVQAIQIGPEPDGQPRTENGVYEVNTVSATGGVFFVVVDPAKAAGEFRYKDTSLPTSDFNGFITAETVIKPVRSYGSATDVEGFLTDSTSGITAQAKDANDGTTPYVLGSSAFNNGDIGTWTLSGRQPNSVQLRKYLFGSAKRLVDILQEELKLARHFMHLDSQGRIAASPLPSFGSASLSNSAITIDASNIITPDGAGGSWEGWEPQRDGLVNKVIIKHGYDPYQDEHLGSTIEVRDYNSIAEHKNRGQGTIEIAPFSHRQDNRSTAEEALEATEIGREIMAFFGQDYAVVTVEVPWSLFNTLVGDLVLFSSDRIPNGDGTRGVTSKRGVVIERHWTIDPGSQRKGELTLLVHQDNGGYTPSARVLSQVNDSGDTWTLTCSHLLAENSAWAQSGFQVVSDHFAAGDYVRIVKFDDDSDTEVTGVVDSTTSSPVTITVTFDATWTPGSDTWDLIWQGDDGSTATTRQQTYTYVADTGYLLTTGAGARKFS